MGGETDLGVGHVLCVGWMGSVMGVGVRSVSDCVQEVCRLACSIAATRHDNAQSTGLDQPNSNGNTPLMAAVGAGNEVMAFELVRGSATLCAGGVDRKQPFNFNSYPFRETLCSV